MRADWDLSDEIERKTGWRVNFYAGDDPAQKQILQLLDQQVNRVVKALGLDPQGAAKRWGRALGTPGSEEGDPNAPDAPQQAPPEGNGAPTGTPTPTTKPKKKVKKEWT